MGRSSVRIVVVVALLLVLLAVPSPVASGECVGLERPVEGAVVAGFAPVGRYGGHWGVDLAVPEGSTVRAPGPGVVSFSGEVAGTAAVTVDHGGGLKTAVSSVAERLVAVGTRVVAGRPLARSGIHDGRPSVHVSARIDGRYVDPLPLLGCAAVRPAGAVRLVPLP